MCVLHVAVPQVSRLCPTVSQERQFLGLPQGTQRGLSHQPSHCTSTLYSTPLRAPGRRQQRLAWLPRALEKLQVRKTKQDEAAEASHAAQVPRQRQGWPWAHWSAGAPAETPGPRHHQCPLPQARGTWVEALGCSSRAWATLDFGTVPSRGTPSA